MVASRCKSQRLVASLSSISLRKRSSRRWYFGTVADIGTVRILWSAAHTHPMEAGMFGHFPWIVH
jgi:hypothetical protein